MPHSAARRPPAAGGMQTVPTKSVAMGRALGHATARSPADFEVEARNAADRPSKLSGDQVRVKFSAPANTTQVAVTDLGEGRYKCEYEAPNAGTYNLSVTMNGEHITGSPFKLVVKVPRAQAELSTVSGKNLSRLVAGEAGVFTVGFVDRLGNQAPPEELDIRVKPKGAPDLPRDENDDLVIAPKVQSTFDKFDADGSGDIDFTELRQALDIMGLGGDRKAAAVLLRRYDSDGGGLSIQEFAMLVADMQMAQATGYLLRGVVPSSEKGSRDVKYEVRVAGDYEMSIGFSAASGGGVLTGSPFSLAVVPAKASADSTEMPPELAGGLKTAVGESGSFVIHAHDVYKNRCTRGGDRVRVVASSASLTASVSDRGDGSYEIDFKCDESGVHKLSIYIGAGESHIRGSPLAVACEPGPIDVDSCELIHSGANETTSAGVQTTLQIRARVRARHGLHSGLRAASGGSRARALAAPCFPLLASPRPASPLLASPLLASPRPRVRRPLSLARVRASASPLCGRLGGRTAGSLWERDCQHPGHRWQRHRIRGGAMAPSAHR